MGTRHGRMGMAAGIALLSGMCAAAAGSVVVYDNSDGTFGWEIGVHDLDGSLYPGTFLDITQPPTQSGDQRPGAFGKWYYPNFASDEPAIRRLIGESGAEAAKTTDVVSLYWNDHYVHVRPTRDYAPGETVSVSDNWSTSSTYFYHLPFSSDLSQGTPAIGDHAYLGVRVKMTDAQWHYGWILFIDFKTPVMWAYETEPNVPVQIPVPGPSAAGLVIVVGLGLRSRQR